VKTDIISFTLIVVCGVSMVGILTSSKARLTAEPNTIVLMSTNDPAGAKYLSREQMAASLIADGTICKAYGHHWNPYIGPISLPAINPPPPVPVLRVCSLCKRTEEQVCSWREVEVLPFGVVRVKEQAKP
jgi:hypothetical protein